MNKVKKAIAGGIAGGVTAVAGFAFGGTNFTDEVGKFIGLFVGGFVVGFIGVYVAPANSPAASNGTAPH